METFKSFKLLFLAICILLFAAGGVMAFKDYAKSSELRSSDALIVEGKVYLSSVLIITDGTNDATVTIHDALNSGSGTVFYAVVAGGDNWGGRVWVPPLEIENGIYVDVSGTGAKYIIEYVEE